MGIRFMSNRRMNGDKKARTLRLLFVMKGEIDVAIQNQSCRHCC